MSGGCNFDKRKYSCGEPFIKASGILLEDSVPEWSVLNEAGKCNTEKCINAEDAVRELYVEISRIKKQTDLSILTECMRESQNNREINDTIVVLANRLCGLINRYNGLRSAYEGLPACRCGDTESCY
jgi:hypothetical protein